MKRSKITEHKKYQTKKYQTKEQLLAFLVQVDEQALMSSLHRLIGSGRVAASRAADVYHDVKKARCAMKGVTNATT